MLNIRFLFTVLMSPHREGVLALATSMLRTGLIGFLATGKTTLFRLLTRTDATNHTGRTGRGETSVGIAQVPDKRLDRLTELFQPQKKVPATIGFADSASRVATGTNHLLDVAPYREADALLHVVRTFRDAHVAHPMGSIDPTRDVRAMEDELILADLGVAERRLERIERDLKKGAEKNMQAEARLIRTCTEALSKGIPLRALKLDPSAAKLLRGFQFLSAKPLLLVINVDESEVTETANPDESVRHAGLTDILTGTSIRAVPVCAKIELEIAELEPDDASMFMTDLGLEETGLARVIRAAYELLGYISFFTIGKDECRAWSIPAGEVAHVAAGEIHTDIERGFIRAEAVAYRQLIQRRSLSECRQHGEVRLEGKDYVVRDGDVINFRFAT